MERVSQTTVIRHWIRGETVDLQVESETVEPLDDRKALDRLLQLKPGAAAFIWRDAPIHWYRVELTRSDFLDLQVVAGPDNLGWRALSPDGTVRGAADLLGSTAPGEVDAPASIDLDRIRRFRSAMPAATADTLVLSTRRGCVPWRLADGNHRAVATALYLLDGGSYDPQPAFLGVGANPVATPIRQRLCGWVRRLFGWTDRPAHP